MRETIRHILHLGTMAAFVLSWSSCSEEDALPAADGELHPTITLVTSIGGMGDNGYNAYPATRHRGLHTRICTGRGKSGYRNLSGR